MNHFLKYFLLFFIALGHAQINYDAPWVKQLGISSDPNLKINYNQVVASANSYWETHDKNAKGSGYKLFKRWEAYWQNYVDESGFLPTQNELSEVWQNKNSSSKMRLANQSMNDQSNWMSVGPTDFLNRSTSYLNLGRINCITPDPTNPDILYAGAPAGGIWKSTDGGLSYVALSDDLPQIGVSSIAIDYTNPNIIYIATGDDDAGDSYSVGVWKSTNAGASWIQTGLNPDNSPSRIYELEIHKTDPNILWAATNGGLLKTSDGGNSWTLSQNGAFQGIKQKPGDSSTVYAITTSDFYKSTNEGDSFVLESSFGRNFVSSRMVLDVTPANPELVYLLVSDNNYGFEGIYRSSDSGNTFVKMDNTTDIYESNQAWFDLAFAVSDTNENELYVGVLNVWKSSDGGDSFVKLNNWYQRNEAYTHADIHFLKFYNSELYVGSDGGFFRSSNQGSTFSDMTGNMAIGQFYRVSVSKQTPNKIAGGTQDNGGFGYFNQWNNYHGGDGMESVIDPNNDNLYYGFMQSGQTLFVNESSGMGQTQGYGGPTNGNWITPLAINSASEVFAGYNRLYEFENGSFTPVSSNFGSNIDVLELDPIDTDIIYVAINSNLYKSTDHGVNFTNLGSFPNYITSIEVNNNNNNIVYVTIRGTAGNVYQSLDQASSFSDISGNLPAVVKNVIKHQLDTPENVLYLGTNLGVYRYDDNTSDWFPFEINLPNTSVRDLSINIPENQIIASTYGRGIWRSDMASTSMAANDIKLLAIENPSSTSVSCGSVNPQLLVKNNGQNTITEVVISYSIDNQAANTQTWIGTINSLDQQTIELQSLDIAFGEHELSATVTIENDTYSTNNTATISFRVNKSGETQTVNTFEAADDELLIATDNGDSNLWQRGVPNGEQLNSAVSGTQVYATNLNGDYSDNTKTYLYSPCYDLTNITEPFLKFDMAFDIEFDWDLLYVQYSTDLGQNWNLLGTSEDPNWYNSSRIAGDGVNNDCYNCVGGQWTGTNTEMSEYSYDLQPLTDSENIIFRFVFHSDEYVTEEGVVLDNLVIEGNDSLNTTGYELQQIVIYPNPSSDIFNIKMSNISDFEISVIDITGKLLFKDLNSNKSSNYSLDMTNFSSGVYFLQIEANNRSKVIKLMLN